MRETADFGILVPGTRPIGGLTVSLAWDTPAGPSIVVAATASFVARLVMGVAIRERAG